MPSERRLHPASFIFYLAGHARELIVPGLLVVFTAGTTGRDWQPWLMVLFLPVAGFSFVRYLSYRYRFEESELVVRTGFVFRNERHIPYARIQNIDAVQNVFHRLLGVVEVRVETGAGAEPDAIMRVLPVAALQEVREHVFRARPTAAGAAPGQTDDGRTLLALSTRELLLSGFLDNRGAILIAAAFGLLWEVGMLDRLLDAAFGEAAAGRGVAVQLVRSMLGDGVPPLRRIALMLGALALLLLFTRVLSMLWAVIRLHGFTLRRAGEDVRTEFGLFTRVTATIPLRRIQTVTISEGPLYRLFRRVSVKVDTAGGDGGEPGAARREPLAPIIQRDSVFGLLGGVLPELDFTEIAWRPAARGAFRRALNRASATAFVIALACVRMLEWWTLGLLAVLLGLAAVHAHLHVSHLGWTTLEGAVLCKRGWLWRRISIARYSKMQVVALVQSPFDRRTRMARLIVDTAGADAVSPGVEIPYMALPVAQDLHASLLAQAAQTEFRW